MFVNKVIDIKQLEGEMLVAGLTIRGLGRSGTNLFTYTVQGAITEPPAGAQAVVDAHVPTPPPGLPDYGTDDTPRDQLADTVTQLRQYLAVASPTNAQTIAAFKLLVRVVLYILRRASL